MTHRSSTSLTAPLSQRGRERRYSAGLLVALLLCHACATTARTRVVVDYNGAEPIGVVSMDVVNDTGHELQTPPAGLIEQAVHIVSGQPDAAASVTDAFAHAAAAWLAEHQVRIVPPDTAAAPRLQISLMQWDVRNDGAPGAVVFVGADYTLLGARGEVRWHVIQERLPIRLSGPNISRFEVARAADACVAQALATLARAL